MSYTEHMQRWLIALFLLSAAGLCFSGYLSAVKLFNGTCAFNEPCQYFLGYPACWYGFVMYLVMFTASLLGLAGLVAASGAIRADLFVSGLGILFSGSFAVQEFFAGTITGRLGLSTCAYGLIFYVAIFIVSLLAARNARAAT